MRLPVPPPRQVTLKKYGGGTQNRTGDKGFADLCLTAWLCRHMERKTGLEPATPTLARLYSTPEPLAHLLIFILLSARCTLQMILYRNSPHLSIPIFNFFQKKSKVSTIPSIFALHQTPAQLSSPHKFTPNHPPDESRLLSIRPPNPTCSRRSASWRIQTLYPRPHRQTSRGFVPAVQRA